MSGTVDLPDCPLCLYRTVLNMVSMFPDSGTKESHSCLQYVCFETESALISTVSAFVIAAMGFRASDVTEQGKDGVWFTFTISQSSCKGKDFA